MNFPEFLKPSTPARVFWIFLFLNQFAASLYQLANVPSSGAYQLLSTIVYGWLIWWWLNDDSKRYGIRWPHDLGIFLYLGWFLIVPYYLVKTRDFNGIVLILIFFAAQIAAWLLATIVWVMLLQ